MIKFDNKVYRNLEEQVLKNKSDIEDILQSEQVLADFGIKIVGSVAEEDQLPPEETYDGQYGDAYTVGTETPYSFYIWTRPTEVTDYNHWFNLGPFPVAGPQGIQGPKGDRGERGYTGVGWVTGTVQPTDTTSYEVGTIYLNEVNGNIYKLSEANNVKSWPSIGNIRGPQGVKGDRGEQGLQGERGETGPQGPVGDPGNFVHITGIVNSESDLPRPITDMTAAYLVGAEKHLYIPVGATPATALWTNLGTLNVATYVTSNGTFQSSWDADTKVDKQSVASNVYRIYGIDKNSTDTTIFNVEENTGSITPPTGNRIPMSNAGKLQTATPASLWDCVPKTYVDGAFYPRTANAGDQVALGYDETGNPIKLAAGSGITINSGSISAAAPTYRRKINSNPGTAAYASGKTWSIGSTDMAATKRFYFYFSTGTSASPDWQYGEVDSSLVKNMTALTTTITVPVGSIGVKLTFDYMNYKITYLSSTAPIYGAYIALQA